MPTYTGMARTNFFRVTDCDSFREEVRRLNVTLEEVCEDGTWLMSLRSAPHWPLAQPGEDPEEARAPIVAAIVRHLQDDDVAVFQEVLISDDGCVRGLSLAVDSSGEEVVIDLDDIYGHSYDLTGSVRRVGNAHFGAGLPTLPVLTHA